jgi:hypothetical protein
MNFICHIIHKLETEIDSFKMLILFDRSKQNKVDDWQVMKLICKKRKGC